VTSGPLLALLHLCDSLFPTGAFAHSDGLETATANGSVRGAATLCEWMDVTLDDTLARCDGPAVLLAWRAFVEREWSALYDIDAQIHAMRPSSTARRASRAMGVRLLKTWHQLRPDAALAQVIDEQERWAGVTLPVAFGVVSASAGIDEDAALSGFIYTRLAAAVSSAMRLIPIGQFEAHGVLASLLERVPAIVERIRVDPQAPRSFAPAMDLALINQQYVGSRLFKS
jgi:urease accessory protein